MAQVKATSLREGMTVLYENEPHTVISYHHNKTGRGGAVIQVELQGMRSGKILSNRFRSSDSIEEIYLESRVMQYLYEDGDFFHFMDVEDFHQVEISAEVVGENRDFFKENMEIEILFYGEEPVDFRLPASISLKIVETVPGVKGNTVSNVYKPAKLETGLTVQVPLFVEEGEMVKVDTRTKEYQGRGE